VVQSDNATEPWQHLVAGLGEEVARAAEDHELPDQPNASANQHQNKYKYSECCRMEPTMGNATGAQPPRREGPDRDGDAALDLGFGRIVASEKEALNI
jgi:hypothetical protein